MTGTLTLTARQRQVLAAVAKPGLHAAVSPQYVARVAGELESWQPVNQVVGWLVQHGLVYRAYSGTMLALTDAGREQVSR